MPFVQLDDNRDRLERMRIFKHKRETRELELPWERIDRKRGHNAAKREKSVDSSQKVDMLTMRSLLMYVSIE